MERARRILRLTGACTARVGRPSFASRLRGATSLSDGETSGAFESSDEEMEVQHAGVGLPAGNGPRDLIVPHGPLGAEELGERIPCAGVVAWKGVQPP